MPSSTLSSKLTDILNLTIITTHGINPQDTSPLFSVLTSCQ